MIKKLLALNVCLVLGACSNSGSDSSISSAASIENSDLVLPSQISLIEPKASNSNQAPAFLAQAPAAEGAFLAAGTDYSEAPQRTHVWLEALEPLGTVDSILCFIAQLKPELEVNEGPYTVLADMDSCFENDSGGDDQSSGSQGAVSYTEVIVESTREDASDAPLNVQIWFVMEDGSFSQAIRVNGVIKEGASEENPYGSFVLSYQFSDALDSTDPDAYGKGELATVDTLDGFQGFTLYETSIRGQDESYETSASVVVNPSEDNGIALTGFRRVGDDNDVENKAFAISYNSDQLLLQKAGTFSQLPYKNDDQSGTCLSRDSFTETVWRYGLYSVADGSSVDLNSGFPFLYDADLDSNNDSRGFASYWGIWTEGGQDLSDVTVQRETFDGTTGAEYDLVQAQGRLMKNTVISLNLTEIDGIEFEYFEWNDSNQTGTDFIVEYDANSTSFRKIATVERTDNGQSRTDLGSPVAISLASGENLNMFSNQLGGGVQYLEGSTDITFFKQEFITGNETGTGELFENGTATLYCYERCPKAGMVTSDLSTYDGPYVTDSSTVGSPITYTISNTGDNTLELMVSTDVVAYPADAADSNDNQHQWGVRTGGMVTDTSGLSATTDIYNSQIVTVFYEFETGPNSWNRQAVLVDTAGDIVSFDKPIEFTYRHEDSNDRTGSAGDFDGQTVMLNYGGQGDLWGIPGITDTERGYFTPAFNIADAVIMGPSNSYVVKAMDIEQKMERTDGQCSSLVLNDPAAPVPTDVLGTLNNETVPTVTDAPRYIAGESTEVETE